MHASKLVLFGTILTAMSCGSVEVIDNEGDGDGGSGGNPAVAPSIASISPDNGPLAGGNEITITGENFTDPLFVIMNGQEVTEVDVEDENTLNFTAPPGLEAGQVTDVFVYGDTGFGILKTAYTYNPVPTIEAFEPTFGPLGGGVELTFHGSGFQNNTDEAPTVLVGGVPATNVQVVDDTTLTLTSPSGNQNQIATANDVTLETRNGTATTDQKFVFVRAGLLVGTRVETDEVSFGVHFFDIPTATIVPLIPLADGISRMELAPGAGLVFRSNSSQGSVGFNGRQMWVSLDLRDGTTEILGAMKDLNGNNVELTALANVGAQLRGLERNGNRRVGNINTEDVNFGALGTISSGVPNGGCLAANGNGSAFHMRNGTGNLSTFNLQTGEFVAGPPLAGMPAGNWICHGATTIDNEVFALFRERTFSTPSPTLIVRVDLTGNAAVVATLPNDYSGLSATPVIGF